MTKKEMAQKAQLDTLIRAKNYAAEIYDCATTAVILNREDVKPKLHNVCKLPSCDFVYKDVVSAAFDVEADKTITILNSASYKNPSGCYMRGILSFEESLCHESFLYNVMRDKMDYYMYNTEHSADCGYYDDRAMLLYNVRFFHGGKERLINVLNCSAPQIPLIKRHRAFDKEKISNIFSDRIKFVCDIIQKYPTDVVISGAFGCGFHANNIQEAGQNFKIHLQNLNIKSKIIFSFIDRNKKNLFQTSYESVD